jgi:predicted branched-subunit amino acid permease
MNASHASDGGSAELIGLGILIVLYFMPLMVAIVRKKSNVVAIGILNLWLGWTFVGWVVSLVWAFSKDQAPVVVHSVRPPD